MELTLTFGLLNDFDRRHPVDHALNAKLQLSRGFAAR
jgi:hypothetical protein